MFAGCFLRGDVLNVQIREEKQIKAGQQRVQYGAVKSTSLFGVVRSLAGNAKQGCDKRSASVNFYKRIEETDGKA